MEPKQAAKDERELIALSLDEILMGRRGLKRRLTARGPGQPVRIAILGGSTSSELVNLLELWLLDSGFAPEFYQSDYGKYYVDAVYDSDALVAFKPDVVYVHTSVINIENWLPMQASEEEFQRHVQGEFKRFQEIWTAIGSKLGCLIVQNNFEFPQHAILGNLDVQSSGRTRFVTELNREFAKAAAANPKLLIQDVCSISARVGLQHWFDTKRYFNYKIVTTAEGSNALATSLASMVRAMYGKTKKVLVLDLDNTLWGGVIGDDGVDKIQIGKETPLAEAYTAFQQYCLSLRDRGVLLAVCSKNNEDVAKSGFAHPDAVLKLEHISCFVANWQPKHENIAAIAKALNLGADSFVFVDDNPAERAIVAAQIAGIAVPNVGDDVTAYADIIERGRYFEQISFSNEDLERAALYQKAAERATFEATFADYGEYLDSLQMTGEIDTFRPVYLERIAQLTNKTNQFNLTTKRYTLADMERIADDPATVKLYAKLSDKFGDHGLISIVVGTKDASILNLDLWLMSCRVLKRNVELAVLDTVVEKARELGLSKLIGYYLPTPKNGMVADFYFRLGFIAIENAPGLPEGGTAWELPVQGYLPRNTHIQVMGYTNG